MARIHSFADESGNFDFTTGRSASRYFILTTITVEDNSSLSLKLHELRLQLAWDGFDHSGPFHATEDRQSVRDRVFEALSEQTFRIDATILEKRKAHPGTRRSEEQFYQFAWLYHLKYLAPRIATPSDDLLVVASSIGTRKKRQAFSTAVKDVVGQVSPTATYRTAFWLNACDPCLQVADYCCWAIQRKWERSDVRSYELIRDKIKSEFDLFESGSQHYY